MCRQQEEGHPSTPRSLHTSEPSSEGGWGVFNAPPPAECGGLAEEGTEEEIHNLLLQIWESNDGSVMLHDVSLRQTHSTVMETWLHFPPLLCVVLRFPTVLLSLLCFALLSLTAIPYRASTGSEQGFPCVVFPHREKPVFISWDPCNENRFFPVGNTTQGKPCFHYKDRFAV